MGKEALVARMTGRKRVSDELVVHASDIVEGLRTLGVRSGDNLFAHSSLSAFGYVDGGAEAVCDAVEEAVGPEGTVAVPTFTWRMNHDKEIVLFDVRRDPTENGLIPETFRKRPEALRCDHVCHSLAATGRRVEEMMGDGIHSFGKGSSMYRLYELDFWYVFMGCGFNSCTALHTVEELMQAPYRYYRHFKGSTVIRADGSRVPSQSIEFLLYHPYNNDFGKMEAVFDNAGLLRTAHVGHSRFIAAKARHIVDLGVELLKNDIGYLLREESRKYLAAGGQ